MLGQPELREILSQPQLRQLSQRITARYHLGPLAKEEIAAYVNHRLTVAGLVRGRLFPEATLKRLFRLTGGVPRLINVICDRALIGAFVQGKDRVDTKTLKTAAREVSGENGCRRSKHVLRWILVASLLFIGVFLPATYYILRSSHTSVVAQNTVPPPDPIEPKTDVIAQPAPATLEKPSGVTRAATRDMAYKALFSKWQVAYDPRNSSTACAQARVQGLICLEEKGGLDSLRQTNKPAVMTFLDAKGDEYYATLTTLTGETAVFAIADEMRTVSVKEIAQRWSGGYLLLWRAPPGYKGKLKPGSRGPLVTWLSQQLSLAQGRTGTPDHAPIYGNDMVKQVKEFQIAAGLLPDGVAGSKTMILLSNAAGNGGPMLNSSEGGK
jgi:general secretion pathway protein A